MRRLRYEWKHGGPVVTKAIIAICVVVWLVEEIVYYANSQHLAFFSMVYDASFVPALVASKPWMFLTSMFMHAPGLDIWHILCNMISLWYVAQPLERMLGHWQFLALYLIGGIGGGAGDMLYARAIDDPSAWITPSYGASGAIFGLFGALLVVFSRAKVDMRPMIAIVLLNLALPFFVPNVAWQAHVGGLVSGSGMTALMVGTPAMRRAMNFLQRTIMSAVVVLVVLAAVVLVCMHTSAYSSFLAML